MRRYDLTLNSGMIGVEEGVEQGQLRPIPFPVRGVRAAVLLAEQGAFNVAAAAQQKGDAVHAVRTLYGSLLYEQFGPVFLVNSAHHQAVDRLGDGLRAGASMVRPRAAAIIPQTQRFTAKLCIAVRFLSYVVPARGISRCGTARHRVPCCEPSCRGAAEGAARFSPTGQRY